MNLCYLNPVSIFVINMRNSLFRLLILFDVFDELQFIYMKVNVREGRGRGVDRTRARPLCTNGVEGWLEGGG